jgi:hypothetical protein
VKPFHHDVPNESGCSFLLQLFDEPPVPGVASIRWGAKDAERRPDVAADVLLRFAQVAHKATVP